MSDLYSPGDMLRAVEFFRAACGHGALAAALGLSVSVVCVRYFADDLEAGRSWVNMPAMEGAIARAGRRFRALGRSLPVEGVAMIQWTGPWMRPGVPPRVACLHRHWIASRAGLIWDANLEQWVTLDVWEAFVPELLPPKADGWAIARGYEIAPV